MQGKIQFTGTNSKDSGSLWTYHLLSLYFDELQKYDCYLSDMQQSGKEDSLN